MKILFAEVIFKDNRKVIPDLWYRYLTMMQEQECHIYQAYSTIDTQKRDEKLEELKELRIEGDKFLHFHFKKMQKMKMNLRAVKEIQKWRIEMEARLNTFNKILKVQPFAKAGTTFVPKEPDEEGEK
ncbi:hypothetical protein Tco_0232786 [Tanacetum coccineum]|uniref:Uncharacterized protein n=1 Tax=Tanacetum coccineum TaxID=301880 RepID=A0ABQ4XUK7_9ASTR